ncbi:MAG: ABC transporter permease [Candidatus Auribacterota bacterium]|nr:ABC transporter permease [Candidatus Auribacterota bacterium]
MKRIKAMHSLVPVLIFLLIWEIVTRLKFIPGHFFFPPFTVVIQEFYHLTANGVLIDNFLRSLVRVLIGLFAGSFAGITVGILMGYEEKIHKIAHPIFSLFYPIPALGWLPILMLWFGIGELLPIIIIFICSFFPVFYNTVTGIREVNKDFIKAAQSLGASERKILTTVIIPLALPNIFTGLRLEAGMAWRVIVAAEMVAIPTGIGALLMRAESLLRIDTAIVCLIVLAVMCFTFEKFFICLEHKLTHKWR